MKNILILTDFSANAMHAAQTGVMVAKRLHANILLFNAAEAKPAYAGGRTFPEEVFFLEEDTCDRLKALSHQIAVSIEKDEMDWKPSVNHEVRLSTLSSGIKSLSKEKTIELIVMGAGEGSPMDHFWAGSDTLSVLDHANRPVLVIPYGVDMNDLKNVVFATNFEEQDIEAIRYLAKWGSIFNFHLEIIHVDLISNTDLTKELRKKEFMKHLHRLHYPNISVQEIYGKDIINRLSRLCDESGVDLLAFAHYKDSFFSRVFRQGTTRKALGQQKMPMLIFPSNFET
ncbi:MAG: universal stress protein [Mucilaginibacter sp.]|nr:universal stress protein [Mucilaginibacter sp.]